jgi:hypothetical protein
MDEIPSLNRSMISTTLTFSTLIVIVSFLCFDNWTPNASFFRYGIFSTMLIWDIFMVLIHFEQFLGKNESNILGSEISFFGLMVCQFFIGISMEVLKSFSGLSVISMMVRIYIILFSPVLQNTKGINSKGNLTLIMFGTGIYLFISLSILNRYSFYLFK